MRSEIDHVVLWVEDLERSIAFYERIVGFEGVRLEAFRSGEAPFPSVRVGEGAILDLMPLAAAPAVDRMSAPEGSPPSAGHPVNHVCFTLDRADLAALRARLREAGVPEGSELRDSFGARGLASVAVYFRDPDGNVLEARTYDR